MVGSLENNVYIVSSEGQAVIIDAAAEPERILEATERFHVTAILTTHGHHDHVGAAARVARTLDVPFRLHPADVAIAGMDPDTPLSDGEVIRIGTVTLTAVHTPGHTPGSTCFVSDGVVFSGDTLFPGGPGATRFPYSDFDTIMRSLDEHLFTLDDAT
ncbi:MAG: MBL fold metallo-hydrolase, partial [Actinobacteria bacterium]|nr:MBL fold metallo-hydrolase [Actinomycetota bacterium]NIV58798.1 MBL fold metallo-hydrolase [Actinomycetota bacterium]NIX53590.1 MBL fold metallo-hydrolase [Actinomycetota bacterium]